MTSSKLDQGLSQSAHRSGDAPNRKLSKGPGLHLNSASPVKIGRFTVSVVKDSQSCTLASAPTPVDPVAAVGVVAQSVPAAGKKRQHHSSSNRRRHQALTSFSAPFVKRHRSKEFKAEGAQISSERKAYMYTSTWMSLNWTRSRLNQKFGEAASRRHIVRTIFTNVQSNVGFLRERCSTQDQRSSSLVL